MSLPLFLHGVYWFPVFPLLQAPNPTCQTLRTKLHLCLLDFISFWLSLGLLLFSCLETSHSLLLSRTFQSIPQIFHLFKKLTSVADIHSLYDLWISQAGDTQHRLCLLVTCMFLQGFSPTSLAQKPSCLIPRNCYSTCCWAPECVGGSWRDPLSLPLPLW